MQKKIFIIVLGFLLVGTNAFAAGDLTVNGKLGVGGANTSQYKMRVADTNVRGMTVNSSMNTDGVVIGDMIIGTNLSADVSGTSSGSGLGILLLTTVSSTASNIAGATGGSFTTSLASSSAGTSTVASTVAGKFDTLLNPGNHNYNVTNGYGFDLYLRDFRTSGTGTLHFDDFKHVNINNATNGYGALSVDNLTGVRIQKQTLGGTSNYGIVLDGEGSGADLAFGLYSGTRPRIYTNLGEIKVQDSAGNVTQISPHDPETGEWIYYSKNVKTGRVVRVEMEKLVKAVEKITGEKFLVETVEEIK